MDMVLRDHKSCSLDYKASDDAWYTVRFTLRGETITLRFCDFSDVFDERYTASDFKDPEKLEAFIKKFRPICSQLQDHECRKIVAGTTVCASNFFENGDVKFYDAVVMKINAKDHKFGKEDACTCTFSLYWLNGPNVGSVTESDIGHICLLQSGNVQKDPVLSAFLDICRKKHIGVPKQASSLLKDTDTAMQDPLIRSKLRPRRHDQSLTHCSKEMTGLQLAIVGDSASKDSREAPFHFVLIENLERDLSPLTIVDFIKKNLSITCQAQVFPSSSSEPYTKGIIVVDSQEKVKKLVEFLRDPSHLILSSKERPWVITEKKSLFLHNPAHMTLMARERPWVITEKKLRGGAVGTAIGHLLLSSEIQAGNTDFEVGNEIRVVRSGTAEYEMGKELRDLFLEFADHQHALYLRYAFEEDVVLRPSNAP